MRDGWLDASWDEAVELMGQPIACSMCLANDRLTIVGFLTEVDGRPALSPAVLFRSEDPDWPRTEAPHPERPPEVRKAVRLTCRRCHRSTCDTWTARAIAARVSQGKPWVP